MNSGRSCQTPSSTVRGGFALLFLTAGLWAAPARAAHDDPEFDQHIRPLLDLYCVSCHGPREDGMGISDTFPLKLGLSQTHHKLSHASDKTGQHDFARFDRFLSEQLHHLFTRLDSYPDTNGTLLDNTLVLYGTGASTTHKSSNLPHLIAGASNMGLTHGHHRRHEMERLSNLYLSILHSLGIPDTAFADSTGRLEDSLFTYA